MANVVASLTRKFERGFMPKIRAIMKEESDAFYNEVSNTKAQGGIWAYDYDNDYNEHSVDYWRKDIVRVGNKIKVVVWNDKPLRNYYNYVAKIAHDDLSPQTSSEEYAFLYDKMIENIKTKIRLAVRRT